MTTTSMAELPSLKGQELGSSPWFEVTQDRVNTFAEATDDRQWIHLDVERAKRESPFGGPVATATSPSRCSSPCGRTYSPSSTRPRSSTTA